MRHSTAVEITAGGWHYADLGRTGGYPLGYCRGHAGHATELDARECYAQYQRDNIKLDGKCSWTSCMAGRTTDPKTSVRCPNPANQYARIEGDGYAMVTLCPEHLTIENAVVGLHLDGPAGDSWHS